MKAKRFIALPLALLGILAILILPLFTIAAVAKAQTAQGVFMDLKAAGTFTISDHKMYQFNIADTTLVDANGVALPAAAYFTNTLTSGPTVTCSGSSSSCSSTNQPSTPTAPIPDDRKVTGPNGTCKQQQCTFLDGGTLTGSDYKQYIIVKGKNGNGSWTFTWTYMVAPDPSKDVDPAIEGVQITPFTAWVLIKENTDVAIIDLGANIAGESVVKNTTKGTKYSFRLRDSYGNSRVTGLSLLVNNVTLAYPGSTLVENCPDCLVGDPGAVDFYYTTNAGAKGYTTLLKNGDARTLLNTDWLAGNDNGGSDGKDLAMAVMDPLQLIVGAGTYTVTLKGTVKGTDGLANITFSVTQSVQVITPGCGKGN
ncbi:MAG: hypothetical protein HY666_06960 [Chloroflexi bacterium]|nr:hypothetical protein [Chloroflexota bacterium]